MSMPVWRKSTYSSGNGNCVEVADTGDVVLVRDSKDPDGPVLRFDGDVWTEFLSGAKRGDFDLTT